MQSLSSKLDRKKIRTLALVAAALAIVALPGAGPDPVDAQDQPAGTVLRIACIAPRGSPWHRVYTAWSNSLREATGGRLSLQIETAGANADEQSFVQRIGRDDLDGAMLSALGLATLGAQGSASRPTLVLQAPGLFTEYAPLDRTRAAMDTELRAGLREGGVELMGWSDLGRGRIFSTHPVATPADLRGAHMWQPANEPLSAALLAELGNSQTVSLPMAQVLPAINAGRVDTVVASAMAVNALGWNGQGRLTHVSSQPTAVLVGATVISASDVAALPADVQEQLRSTAARAHETLQRTIRRDDDRAYETLTTRGGMTAFAFGATGEWDALAQRTRARLVTGGVLPRALLDRAAAR
jgi:TRAP-type C4-dicarboxylate transport system substrate-binding protein